MMTDFATFDMFKLIFWIIYKVEMLPIDLFIKQTSCIFQKKILNDLLLQ